MIKKYKKLIIIALAVICVLSIFSYKYIVPKNEKRIEIESLSAIEIYKFNSFTKFSREKTDTITDNDKLIKFKMLFNSLDESSGIKKVDLPEDINLKSFQYYAHIKPDFKYIEDNGEMEDGHFLLYLLVNNSEGNSYITFEPSLAYVLDNSQTEALKQIFLGTKY